MINKNRTITFAHVGDCIIDYYLQEDTKYLGGTAFNSAFFAAQAGAQTYIFSAVGTDKAGKEFRDACNSHGIQTEGLEILEGQTSSLDIDTKDKNNPIYSHWQLGVLENFTLSEKEQMLLESAQIAKISLFWPMKALFEQFVALALPRTRKMADFSGLSAYSEGLASLEKYAHGCDIIVKSLPVGDSQGITLLQTIARKQNKLCVALLGEKGSVIFTQDKTYTHRSTKVSVVDTNGAGDSFLGNFGYWYCLTENIPLALEKATEAASKVVQLWGATGIEFNG